MHAQLTEQLHPFFASARKQVTPECVPLANYSPVSEIYAEFGYRAVNIATEDAKYLTYDSNRRRWNVLIRYIPYTSVKEYEG